MNPEEHMATQLILADFDESQEILVDFLAYFSNGTQDKQFNPLDNDYVEVFTANWDVGLNKKEGKDWTYLREGPGFELCSDEKMDKVLDIGEQIFRNNTLCVKNK